MITGVQQGMRLMGGGEGEAHASNAVLMNGVLQFASPLWHGGQARVEQLSQ